MRRLGPEALAARDREGRTVLHAAAAAGEAEAVAVLVDMGADTSAADARGRTPMDVAREKGYVSGSIESTCLSFLLSSTIPGNSDAASSLTGHGLAITNLG